MYYFKYLRPVNNLSKNFEPFISFLSFLIVETRNRILSAAQSLFIRYGIRSVTMDDIAKELGISKKTIYLHFPDKDSVINEATYCMLSKEKSQVEEIHKLSNNPIMEMINSTKMMSEMLEDINPVLFYDLKKYYPAAWQKYELFKLDFLEIVKRNLCKGIEQGYYREDIDVEVLSRLRIENVDMAFNIEVFQPKNFKVFYVQLQFIDHFIRGILSPKGLEFYENSKNY